VSAVLVALAAAVLIAPGSVGARRLRGLDPVAARRRSLPRTTSTLGTAVTAAAVTALLVGPVPALAAALVAATAHRRLLARRTARRDTRAATDLAAAVEVVVAELRVGAHPATACAVAAAEVGEPVHRVLAEAAARARLGGSAADGLHSGDPGLDTELDRVAAAWRVADERGVALAELLDAVRRDLLGRTRFRRRTEAGLAGARATATVLAGLPLLGIALGQAVGAAPVQLLLGSTGGGLLLLVGTVLVCAGLAWSGRITARVGAQ
jgi:tight adherence protein B